MSTKVSEAMHHGVEHLSPDAPLTALSKIMKAKDVGMIPIVDDNRLVGVVTDRDIVVRGLADGGDPARMTARDLMSTDVVCCNPDEPLSKAAKRMAKARVRRLPVIEDGALVGILSLGDVSQAEDDDDDCADLIRAVSDHHD